MTRVLSALSLTTAVGAASTVARPWIVGGHVTRPDGSAFGQMDGFHILGGAWAFLPAAIVGIVTVTIVACQEPSAARRPAWRGIALLTIIILTWTLLAAASKVAHFESMGVEATPAWLIAWLLGWSSLGLLILTGVFAPIERRELPVLSRVMLALASGRGLLALWTAYFVLGTDILAYKTAGVLGVAVGIAGTVGLVAVIWVGVRAPGPAVLYQVAELLALLGAMALVPVAIRGVQTAGCGLFVPDVLAMVLVVGVGAVGFAAGTAQRRNFREGFAGDAAVAIAVAVVPLWFIATLLVWASEGCGGD